MKISKKKPGRKPMHGIPMRMVKLRADDATIEGAKRIGDKNFSEGVRRAVADKLLTMDAK